MLISDSCEECLFDIQKKKVAGKPEKESAAFLAEARQALKDRREDDSAPYMVYICNAIYRKHFGSDPGYADVKKQYNDFVSGVEPEIERLVGESTDPLKASLFYARLGNYIDFAAMKDASMDEFMSLFKNVKVSKKDEETYASFTAQCKEAKTFLLLADNTGEIVLDKLFIKKLRERFPGMKIYVMVRGGEALNDVTPEDAKYIGLDRYAEIITNGCDVAGTVYSMLPKESKEIFDSADVILSKGQGNYETIAREGFHIFYSFLCKCDVFTDMFGVPRLTGMFIEASSG